MPGRLTAAALAAVALSVAVVVGVHAFFTGEQPVRVGAHVATTSPTVDGKATLVVGGLAPSLRTDSDLPLGMGVQVTVVHTEAPDLETMLQRDALIAGAPQGEIGRVRQAVADLAIAAALRGLATAAVTALGLAALWHLVGADRRRELVRRPRRPLRPVWWAAAAMTVALLGGAALLAPSVAEPSHRWTPLRDLVPEAGLDPTLSALEITEGATTTSGVSLIRGAIATYRDSVGYYDALADRVSTVADRIRQPEEDEVVALLVSDRHDNVGMDRVAREIGDAGGATVLIDAGDDTASGGAWEDFSIDSLAAAFEGYDVVAVTGNHDSGGAVAAAMADAGFTVLDERPEEVAGIEFVGVSDPRFSDFAAGYQAGPVSLGDAAAALAEAGCKNEAVSTVVVHSPSMGTRVAESGCVDLVLSGHVHRQLGPEPVESPEGRTTITYSNGTTGGAAYAFALGSALRRPAQVTLVTFAAGRPRGLQPVDIDTDGEITVQRYHPLQLTERRVD